MISMFWLILGGASVAGASYLYKTWRSRTLPTKSEEEFLMNYREFYSDPSDLVLQQRRNIASHLGLPPEKLSPDLTFKEISDHAGFVGEYEVGMGDLEEVLRELYQKASLKMPGSFPVTVGELIHEIVTAQKVLTDLQDKRNSNP